MKVLHVEAGKHFYGGARQVAFILEGLHARGIDNVLACPVGSDIATAAAPFATVVPMAMGGDADIALAGRLKTLIRTARPDVVHLHSRRGADLWGGVAARLAGVPCVLSRRVDNPEPRWLVMLKYRLYDHVITISEGIRDVLLAEGLAPEKVSCVRSALDATPWLVPVDRAAFCREFDLPADALTIAMAAQLIPRKGHRYLLDALPPLLAEFPALHAVLFGKGPLEAELRAEIAARGLADRVRLAGFRDDLPRWLGGADILAHPADMEGLGIALLQASAAGVPIVTSRAGGLPEAVADGVSGLLIPPGDVDALGAALRQLLADPALRRRLGDAGRARILAEFSIDAMVEGNLAVYRQVTGNRPS
ncbi:glycosyltransferase [Aromatoleum toluvorans]|uniref:Glycosyltransferase n=1 Tax=Aromatoleum toluvorans TaxID=92002 RepID=A0ABX1PV40_9RHOO|nr:glycosyltransferase [Aromatoleum toluvorans]